ncbi:NAD(P)H-dependent glycerol-3-phosphate dehydrogenase [Jiulongibacter sediminis]|uniref:Glycerol-3-phosphate dehydrogenase [NAD(P)+] n=1 Tax=Jiulongibacter sediminis TaxID=1605367 RepID=A0A0P7BTA3_9BACT|nr:NAD(P)H-dependent glycerol-3-phosphate dehydrogenase [Jiulongibacter sediminis]KPM47770.1 glycerol-3-phosphate dehydrogenase [Jiulongibacter sediminis]TBX23953.1 glycerol-3-phosphate dehydrogenase [Jiulongibacter sediminis]
MKVSVIGGGSWATAIVKILSENSRINIRWWMRNADAVEHIRKLHHNPKYLSSVEFHPSKVKAYHKIKDAVKGSEIIILAVPAAFLAESLNDLSLKHFENKAVISAIKGMIPETHQLVTDFIKEKYQVPLERQAAIAGPCHAEEVAFEKNSYLTIASPDISLAENFADLMNCRYVRTSAISDLYGVEYTAVMKNIVALACGITHGLGAGDNFQAVMVSNAMLEIKRLLSAVAPAERELNASAYLGDLLVTAYSQFSRNRSFGNMIGRGYSVKTAQLEMNMIAEGYYAVKSIAKLNEQWQIDMPITRFAHAVLYEKNSLKKEFNSLKNSLF